MAWRFYNPNGEVIHAIDHGEASGLGDDDHPQYRDGSIVYTGDLQVTATKVIYMEGENRIRIKNVSVSVSNSGLQTLTNTTLTKILWDTEDHDTDDVHSVASLTSRFTPKLAGNYMVCGTLSYTGNATGVRITRITKNNGNYMDLAVIGGQNTDTLTLGGCLIMALTTSDYIELEGYQSSGGDLTIRSEDTHFEMCYIGE